MRVGLSLPVEPLMVIRCSIVAFLEDISQPEKIVEGKHSSLFGLTVNVKEKSLKILTLLARTIELNF